MVVKGFGESISSDLLPTKIIGSCSDFLSSTIPVINEFAMLTNTCDLQFPPFIFCLKSIEINVSVEMLCIYLITIINT